ncbi:S41 family peptidase [Leptospira tipperaryensis]|nr:S41 family peptidase [Leptospira tipperaryensis]
MNFIEEKISFYDSPQYRSERGIRSYDLRRAYAAAASGFISTLDSGSALFLRSDFDTKENEKDNAGIGVVISKMHNGEVRVEQTIAGSGARKVGLLPGDIILNIDDIPTRAKTLNSVISSLKGPKGTIVKVSIRPFNEKSIREILIQRDIVNIVNVSSSRLGKNKDIGYIKILSFSKTDTLNTDKDIVSNFKQLQKDAEISKIPLKGLVIDIRNNSGGYLHQCIDSADLFLSEGLIVKTQMRVKAEEYKANLYSLDAPPIFILVNSRTASGAELFAEALRENGKAFVLGEITHGISSIQNILPIPEDDEYLIKLTSAMFSTPSGNKLQLKGLSPDILVSEEVDGSFPERYREKNKWRRLPGGIESNAWSPSESRKMILAEMRNRKPPEDINLKVGEQDLFLERSLFYVNGILELMNSQKENSR